MKTLARLPLHLTALAVACIASIASIAVADDAKTYTWAPGARWKAGQAVTRTGKQTEHQSVHVEMVNGEAVQVLQDRKSDKATSFVRVEKCTEADAEGKWVKGLVFFSEWTRTVGEEKDETLKGVVIELSGVAGARAWKTVSEGAAPSDAAKAWFDKELGAEATQDRLDALMCPKKEVAVGDTWQADAAALTELMKKNLPLDAEKADCKVTLKAVDGTSGTIEADFKVPTTGLPNPQTQTTMSWIEGGDVLVKGRLTRSLDGSVGAEVRVLDHGIKGVAGDKGSPVKVTIDFAGHTDMTSKAGGEIPAAAPAKPQ